MAIRAAGPGQEPVDVAVTMRTPGHEAELAVGFLRTEGLIDGRAGRRTSTFGDAATGSPGPTTRSRCTSARPFDASLVAERHFVATASCGICGKASLDEIEVRCAPIPAGPLVVARRCSWRSRIALRAAQAVFEATGRAPRGGPVRRDGDASSSCARTSAATTRSTSSSAAQVLAGAAAAPRPDRARLGPRELRARPEGGGRRRARSSPRSPRRATSPSRRPSDWADPRRLPARRRLQRLCPPRSAGTPSRAAMRRPGREPDPTSPRAHTGRVGGGAGDGASAGGGGLAAASAARGWLVDPARRKAPARLDPRPREQPAGHREAAVARRGQRDHRATSTGRRTIRAGSPHDRARRPPACAPERIRTRRPRPRRAAASACPRVHIERSRHAPGSTAAETPTTMRRRGERQAQPPRLAPRREPSSAIAGLIFVSSTNAQAAGRRNGSTIAGRQQQRDPAGELHRRDDRLPQPRGPASSGRRRSAAPPSRRRTAAPAQVMGARSWMNAGE